MRSRARAFSSWPASHTERRLSTTDRTWIDRSPELTTRAFITPSQRGARLATRSPGRTCAARDWLASSTSAEKRKEDSRGADTEVREGRRGAVPDLDRRGWLR